MHIRRFRVLGLVLSLLLLLAACGGGESAETTSEPAVGGDSEAAAGGSTTAGADAPGVQELRDAGTVRVGIKYDQPLFGVGGPSGVEGFDAEIAKLLVEGIFGDGDPDSHIEFIETVSANREPFLQNDEVDMVITTYTINDERDQVIDFAGPYYSTGQQLMVPEGNPEGIQSTDDLNTPDLTTCSVEGSTSLENFEAAAPQADVLVFDAYSRCAEAMNDGRVDAVTTDGAILYGLISDFEGFEVVGDEFSEEPYGIGIPEGATDVRLYLNERICEIQESGEWDAAYEATVGTVSETPDPPPIDQQRYPETFPEGSTCPQATEGGATSEAPSDAVSEPDTGSVEVPSEVSS